MNLLQAGAANKNLDPTSPLTEAEKHDFFALIGRPIPDEFIPSSQARLSLNVASINRQIGKRYTRRVWSKLDIHSYLDEQLNRCVAHAVSFIAGVAGQTYFFANPNGPRFDRCSSGKSHVHFRRINNDWLPILGMEPTAENEQRCINIERIELHPSIQRHGFLRKLIDALRGTGIIVQLSCVVNPALAYHYWQRSLSDQKVVVLTPDRTDFERNPSPCPSYAFIT